ncbi:MAG: hypothetical protein ACOC2Q_03995 [Spirochaetota bacterium]
MSQHDHDRLVVQSNVGRRALFGGIALLLLVSFVVGVDFERDFADGMITGTVFYFAITAICAVVAGWNSIVLFDRAQGRVEFIRKLFGIRLGSSSLELGDIRAVVLRGLRFLRESEQPQPGMLNQRFRGYVERRNVYYKLHLETDETLHFVEDSTDLTDLESAAQGIADFLGVTYRREEI